MTTNHKNFATPAELEARRDALHNLRRELNEQKADGILRRIFNYWHSHGQLCDVTMFTNDGHDDAVAAFVRVKLDELGWHKDTHYALTRDKDATGNTFSRTITFNPEYTSFEP